MTQPLRVALIGAGAIAQSYIEALEGRHDCRLTAVVDKREVAATTVAEQLGATSHDSHETLVESGACDAAIVATPPASHTPIVLDLLDQGIPVLCEKPLCIDVASARTMSAAAVGGPLLTMASKFRCVDDLIQAKAMLASGMIGDLVLLENTFASPVDMRQRWNSDPSISGGGVLIDNGTHSVDIVRYLAGPAQEVLAIAGPTIQALEVEESATLLIRTASGAQATIDLSWGLAKERPAFVTLYGRDGTIEVGWRRSRYRRAHDTGWTDFGNGYDKRVAFRRQIDNFIGVVRGEQQPLMDIGDALASVIAVQAAYASLASGCWTRLVDDVRWSPKVAALGREA